MRFHFSTQYDLQRNNEMIHWTVGKGAIKWALLSSLAHEQGHKAGRGQDKIKAKVYQTPKQKDVFSISTHCLLGLESCPLVETKISFIFRLQWNSRTWPQSEYYLILCPCWWTYWSSTTIFSNYHTCLWTLSFAYIYIPTQILKIYIFLHYAFALTISVG